MSAVTIDPIEKLLNRLAALYVFRIESSSSFDAADKVHKRALTLLEMSLTERKLLGYVTRTCFYSENVCGVPGAKEEDREYEIICFDQWKELSNDFKKELKNYIQQDDSHISDDTIILFQINFDTTTKMGYLKVTPCDEDTDVFNDAYCVYICHELSLKENNKLVDFIVNDILSF